MHSVRSFFVIFIILLLTAGLLACQSPSGNNPAAASSAPRAGAGGDTKMVPDSRKELVPPSDVNQNYTFAGSCIHPQGFCVQVYSPDAADAITQLVLLGKNGCRLLKPGKEEPQCQEVFTRARCLGSPVQPQAAPPGTIIQMDLYFDYVPGQESKAACEDNGGTFSIAPDT